MTPPDARAQGWRVVIPAQGAPNGKSRLHHPQRAALSRALARDTLEMAALAVGADRLLVVTGDDDIRGYAEGVGARVLTDPGGGLNAAIRAGVVALGPGPVAALLGDIPSARAEDLATALAACAAVGHGVVPDHTGVGSVLLAAYDGALTPDFGPASAQHHLAAGYRPVGQELARLRRDVDVHDDLASVLAFGCGRHTAEVLAGWAPIGSD
ncbi:2-phospho-L-lactate guanylyltransferase [Nostocoides vanveenii]